MMENRRGDLRLCLLLFFLCSQSWYFLFAAQNQDLYDEKNPYKAIESFAQVLYYLETMYVEPEKAKLEQSIDNAIAGIVSNLDPHTVYLRKEEFERLKEDTKGQYGGLGILIRQDKNRLIIVSTIPASPSAKAGIREQDEIVMIEGKKVSEMQKDEILQVLQGPIGSKARLKIKRGNSKELLNFEIVRDIVKTKSVLSESLAPDIYYLRIASFQEDTEEEVYSFLKINEKKIRGLILDLRDNPGGLLDQAIKVVDRFIESGLIVSTVGRDPEKIERAFAHKKDSFSHFPIVCLINQGSASAAEIVAGALQDHKRALILGEVSFGKGSVQTFVPLPNGSGLKITIARYYTPKDRSIQAKGITPDIIVPGKKNSIEIAKGTRESDLERHITGDNLSKLFDEGTILNITRNWKEQMKDDFQLLTAFTYIEGFKIFQKEASL